MLSRLLEYLIPGYHSTPPQYRHSITIINLKPFPYCTDPVIPGSRDPLLGKP